MGLSIPENNLAVSAEDEAVSGKYPRDERERQGDRAGWPWLPGTIVQQCGPDEWQGLRRAHVRGRARGRQQARSAHA
jgi:hypothetical protein